MECGCILENENFSHALVEAVKEIGKVLAAHFREHGQTQMNYRMRLPKTVKVVEGLNGDGVAVKTVWRQS